VERERERERNWEGGRQGGRKTEKRNLTIFDWYSSYQI
jgi:hypothetical protein